jgi:hypothetical protein
MTKLNEKETIKKKSKQRKTNKKKDDHNWIFSSLFFLSK